MINICLSCNAKIKLVESIANKCKCSNIFCNLHKSPENHNCSFDYKSNNKNELTNKNLTITSQKIAKI